MKLLLLIILLTLSLGIASAEVSPVDTGADMVHKGIDSFLYGIADDMYELGVGINSGGANVTDAGTTNAIFTVATFTYDPFEIGAVQDMQLNSAVIFVILMIIYIFLGAAGVLISRFMPSLSDMLTFVFGKNMAFRQYLTNLCIGLFVAMFSYISIRLILTLNYVLSHL
ncbi:MAG: hypothetical protein JXA38_01590, partial [Methanosarcinaceae archaeon]|nr:hypothetical protein [Methanosarcinaceae archaeon]